jgi:hypothetical protein
MHRVIRFALFALTIGLAVSAARTSMAGFSAELTGIVAVGPNFQYNYDLIFQTLPGRARVEAGSGAIAPGTVGSQDFLTIYDVGGGPEFVSATAGPGFTVQTAMTGVNAAQTVPNDEAGRMNVTFRYAGPPATVSADTVFTGFNIVSTLGPTVQTPTRIDDYGSQNTDNAGLDINRKISELGPIEVPPSLIPEPGTWALLILGFIGAVAMRRRTTR